MSPDGKVLVNTSETTNMAHFIDTDNEEDVRQRAGRQPSARRHVQPRTARNSGSAPRSAARLRVIDPKTRKIIEEDRLPGAGRERGGIQPVGIRITNDGKKAFVALGPANRVAVIDTATLKVEKYLLVGQRVWQMDFTPDDKLLFTTNGTSNDVSVIDVENLKVVKSIKVGRYPWGVVVAPF